MTTDILIRPQAAGRLGKFRLRALIEAYIERESMRRQLRQLRRLDDHLLRDIGLSPDDVWSLRH